jgi:hypothetical protein
VPDSSTIGGACTALGDTMGSAQNLFNQIPGGITSLPGAANGALGQLPDLLTQGQNAIADSLKLLPAPLEIPTIPGPQSFSIPLGSNLSPDLSSSLTSMTGVLDKVQSGITGALQQLPSALPSLPSSFSNMGPLLKTMQGQITGVQDQTTEVLERAAVPSAGQNNQMSVLWNQSSQAWLANIADESGKPIVSGIPLVTGANLVEQFGHLGFAGKFIAQTDHATTAVPTYQNLGSAGHLFFVGP